MDVNAIAQANQPQPSTSVPDTGGSSATDLFAFLLKHSLGAKGGQAMLNSQSMLDMVGSAPAYAPPPQVAPPPPTNTNQAQSQTNQSAQANGNQSQANGGQTATAANNNTNNNSGSDTQANGNSAQDQRGSQQSSSGSAATTQTTANTGATTAQTARNATGEDAATEETAAVVAAAAFLTQQTQARPVTIEQVASVKASGPATTGPQQQTATPTTGSDAAQAAAQTRTTGPAQAVDDNAEETPVFTNVASSAPSTPAIAQQAAGLAQITGQSSARVSVQTTSGNAVAPTSTGTLVPDAVIAMPSFSANDQQDASTGGGTSDQQGGGQQGNAQTDPNSMLDPASMLLAQEVQAMSAIAALLQAGPQSIVVAQQAGAAGIAATTAAAAASTAAENALPQPTSLPPSTTPAASFVGQLQEAEQPQQTQATTATTLPNAIDQIKMQIEKGLQQGSTTIKVQLNPENMGRVEVKLDMQQDGTVKATITADRPETLALLKSDQSGMLQALTDAGLNPDSSSLAFFLRGDQQRQFAQTGRQGRNGTGNGAPDDDSTLSGIAATSNASPGSAAAGALDISV